MHFFFRQVWYVYAPRAHARWSLPRSSRSGSRSQSGSERRSDDEHKDQDEAGVHLRVGLGDEIEGSRGTYGSRMCAWKIEAGGDGDEEGAEGMVDGREDGGGKDVRQVEQTWDGMEMEMD